MRNFSFGEILVSKSMFPLQHCLVSILKHTKIHLQLQLLTAKIGGKFSFSCNYRYAIYKVSLALEKRSLISFSLRINILSFVSAPTCGGFNLFSGIHTRHCLIKSIANLEKSRLYLHLNVYHFLVNF